MTAFTRRAAALAFTTLASALLLVAAVGPAQAPATAATSDTAPVAQTSAFMA